MSEKKVTINFSGVQQQPRAAAAAPAPAAPAAHAAAPAVAPAGGVALEMGRGLDIGTANLVSAVQDTQGNLVLRSQRNAFLDINTDDFTRNMLNKLNVAYAKVNNQMVVIGDAAFELANIFNRETRRPMKHGVIAPDERDALPIEKMLIESLLGPPSMQNEICYFSVPADPVDDVERNVIYHKGLFEGMLRKLGFNAKPLNEGHAVVFSELAEQDFTGIGISCGGGMFNVCVAYKTIPCLQFSTSRGGDWIDRNVGTVLGIPASKATAIKERGIDLRGPKSQQEEAVGIYYRELIKYTLDKIKDKFERGKDMPSFPEPVDLVFAGGTSKIGGFTDVVTEVLQQIHFPIPIANVRRADDPLTSIAKGCLVAAMSEEE